jgi:hypothetical protein
MTWNRRYQVKSYLQSALWIIPFIAVPLEQVAWVLVRTLDTRFRLEGARTRRHRCAGDVQRCHHACPFVHRLHIWIPPCGNSGRQRAIHTADNCDDLAARQRYPLYGGPFRFHVAFRDQGCGPNGDDRSAISRVRRRAPWFNVHRSFPVFDRLRGENVAPGQSGRARREVRARGNGECLS